ncbi:MAG: hypothetical protein L6R28_24575 [Planctomycetes bacterium]|nr:hypothetical protein [Planctomycetota bacterium]
MQTVTAQSDVEQSHGARWLAILGIAVAVHLAFAPFPALYFGFGGNAEEQPEDDRQVTIEIEPEPLAAALPPDESNAANPPAAVPDAVAPPPEPDPVAPPPEPPPEPETKQPEPPAPEPPPPEPETTPEVKGEESAKAPLRAGFDGARAIEKAPDDAQMLGPENSQAADRSDKKLPTGMAYNEGESSEIAALNPRGDTDLPLKARDPLAGSVKEEGTPDPGKPKTPDTKIEQRSEPVETPGGAVKPAEVQTVAPTPPGGEPEKTETQKLAGADTPMDVAPGKTEAGTHPGPEGQHETIAEGAETKAGVDDPKRAPPGGEQVPETKPEPPRLTERRDERTAESEPKWHQLTPEAKGPEKPDENNLDSLLKDLKKFEKEETSTDALVENPGINDRKGEIGQSGEGRPAAGDLRTVSDVTTRNVETTASTKGALSFAKKADPVSAYLQAFYRRMDTKWKANIQTSNRSPLEYGLGDVVIRITFTKDGKLAEAAVVETTGVSSLAASECKKAIQDALPHIPFGPELDNRESVTETIRFMYR